MKDRMCGDREALTKMFVVTVINRAGQRVSQLLNKELGYVEDVTRWPTETDITVSCPQWVDADKIQDRVWAKVDRMISVSVLDKTEPVVDSH